jgi:hypothetical protein
MLKRQWMILAPAAIVFLLPAIAGANSTYRNNWLNAYPDACSTLVNAANNCTLCHTSPPTRNSYGADLRGTTPQAIEGMDSDGDGRTNGQEILLDCKLPGDAASVLPADDQTWGTIKVLFR